MRAQLAASQTSARSIYSHIRLGGRGARGGGVRVHAVTCLQYLRLKCLKRAMILRRKAWASA